MTYDNGEPMQVGDIAEKFDKNGDSCGYGFVFKKSENYSVMGLFPYSFTNGISDTDDWTVKLIKKFWEVVDGELDMGGKIVETSAQQEQKIITIDGKDIKLSLESFNELKRQLCE